MLRPLSGIVSLRVARSSSEVGDHVLDPRERLVTAFFGVRGVGSLYYLAYASGEADFVGLDQLWATVAFTIMMSVLVHGITATPAMRWLEKRRTAQSESAERT